jgi:hypothetical protein
MITLSIYKKTSKQCGDINNLHKSVIPLWQTVERVSGEGEGTGYRCVGVDA